MDNVSKIKERLDIVDVISGYLKLQKSGINFKVRCPFHNEKSASFFVSPERQIWHCFGCSKGGDMFTFVQEIDGVEFPNALKTFAQRAGIELSGDYNPEVKNEKTVLSEICESATRFFEKQLHNSGTGKRALEYLNNRGLLQDTIKEFRIGFAPAEWESLSMFLRNCGYKDNEIIDAGLAIKREGANGIYDRFRSRIVFPIEDLNGQVVGFTGRVFEGDEKEAKYINTPQTAIYDKGRILYGLHKAKTEIRREDKCIMVEGNMDALMSYQAGVKNTVATSGTALTPNHLRIIRRYTPNLGFCFDTDQAGEMATRRSIGIALSDGFSVKVIELADKECKDPADYVRKHGSGWLDTVFKAKPVIEFYFDKAKEGFDPNSAESKKSAVAILAPFMQRLTSQVERSHWLTQLAFLLRTSEDAVEHDLASAKDDLGAYDNHQRDQVAEVKIVPEQSETDMLSATLLSVVMKNPNLFKEELKSIPAGLLDNYTGDIVARLVDSGNMDEMLKEFREKDQSYKLEFAYLKSQELWKDFKEEELKAEFKNLINKIKTRSINAQLTGLAYDIKEAEANKDKAKIKELTLKFSELINQFPQNG